MRNELAKVKRHLGASVAHAHALAVPVDPHGQVQTTMVPSLTEFIDGDRHRAERGGRFALHKTKVFRQLVGHQTAQRHVVGQHHQADAFQGFIGRGLHRHVAGDHGNFSFKVDAVVGGDAHHVVAGAQKIITATLVHQRVGVVIGRHFGVARGAHQLDVVHVGRAISPLKGTRQGCHAHLGVEGEGVAGAALVQGLRQVLQLRRDEVPVVQQLLHVAGDAARIMGAGQVARHHHQLSIARSVFVSG